MYRVCSVRTTRERPVRPTPSFIYERRDAVTFLRAEVAAYRLLPMLVKMSLILPLRKPRAKIAATAMREMIRAYSTSA